MFIDNPTSGLQERFTSAIMNRSSFPHQSSGMFRPSEASATIQTKNGPLVLGGCRRKTWYRLKGIPRTDGDNLPHQIQRMNVGKEVENSIIETCKREGLYIANNIPFRITMDGIPIAGELDAVLRTEPCGSEKFLAEIKSIYGYYAQKEIFGRAIGAGKEVGKPKDSYLMQISLYLNHFSRLSKEDPSYLPFGTIFICDRGDGHFGVFDVWLEEEMKFLNDDEIIKIHKIYYASPGLDVPKTLVPFTTEDILSNYRDVLNRLDGDIPPERDHIREYDREQVEQKYAEGNIGKSAYQKWISSHGPRGKGKERLGDWQCIPGYCQWSSLCWNN